MAHQQPSILGPTPFAYASQATSLLSAFSTMTVQDPTWNMDTCSSSHLNSSTSNLSTIFNQRLFPSVFVGDGKTIPVTNTGHIIIPSAHRPLHLHNVLVTPNIIKNLIYVRQFTRDNNCTIEFDAFSFSVKDYLTRHILLRCDSSDDLYPVTKPSTLPTAFVSTSSSTWHQRLGHPVDEVLCSLTSRNLISCNKTKFEVVKPATIRIVLSLTVSRKWPIHQLDVKNAFLNGDLSETGSHVAYLLIYVDDIIRTTSFAALLQHITASLHREFDMTDLGPLNYFLGIFADHTPTEGVPIQDPTLYRSLAEGIKYLTLYASATTSLIGYTDANWAGCPTTRMSTSGYSVFLGDNLLSFLSKRQHTISRSSAKAEYRGVANVVAKTAWLRNLLRELHSPLSSATLVYCDNISQFISQPIQFNING
ncbi:ribonuclease H-like domain-containing protein [Tanacetum coccineum]